VLSTLHAGSCRGVFERLLVMCADRFAVTAALELILNQRLLRRLCQRCRGPGCEVCLGTGYLGRVPVVEWFAVDEVARGQMRAQGAAAIQPPQPLPEQAQQLVRQGVTNQAECDRVLGGP
jgi:general secretion pathway protein E